MRVYKSGKFIVIQDSTDKIVVIDIEIGQSITASIADELNIGHTIRKEYISKHQYKALDKILGYLRKQAPIIEIF